MRSPDEQINQLMKAAAQSPRPDASAPFGMETRVLAHWRSSLRNDSGDLMVLWFRRTTICAAVLAVACLAWNHHSLSERSSVELVADSAMGMGVEP